MTPRATSMSLSLWVLSSSPFPPSFQARVSSKSTRDNTSDTSAMTAPIAVRAASIIDDAGASLGCLALAAFARVIWRTLPRHNAWLVILLAGFAWIAVSLSLWLFRKSRFAQLL